MFSLRCRGCDSTFSLYVPAHDDMTKNKIAAQRWIRDTLTFVCGSVPKKKFELIQCMIAYATGQVIFLTLFIHGSQTLPVYELMYDCGLL